MDDVYPATDSSSEDEVGVARPIIKNVRQARALFLECSKRKYQRQPKADSQIPGVLSEGRTDRKGKLMERLQQEERNPSLFTLDTKPPVLLLRRKLSIHGRLQSEIHRTTPLIGGSSAVFGDTSQTPMSTSPRLASAVSFSTTNVNYPFIESPQCGG
jgi:hypothetical protein